MAKVFVHVPNVQQVLQQCRLFVSIPVAGVPDLRHRGNTRLRLGILS